MKRPSLPDGLALLDQSPSAPQILFLPNSQRHLSLRDPAYSEQGLVRTDVAGELKGRKLNEGPVVKGGYGQPPRAVGAG
jgi:hypothetical protein